ncbi:AbrB/MazE/SpoVT family DNA-binding domain-containing protein [Lactobacillus sp. PV034]|uniref:AbrB/MazE/SpoVT family DNA-binding domain-containing protein n=1 Tax=Lactobacillus sp. PV034 TaxID=2594495 RepID=UPI00223EE058|nr:type II toxin-antitoxin system PrlF family antitoxin [Lactobacillus sp. PV034]QNQ80192.1 AbrB/MazE/SpoVT family DNA-binding domain-containing protein [Lactobacillus sp. PV034]
MQIEAKITSKNQITIPKAVREQLGINEKHEKILFNIEQGKVTIEKSKKDNFWQLVKEQQEKYGTINTPEIDWGNDVAKEIID